MAAHRLHKRNAPPLRHDPNAEDEAVSEEEIRMMVDAGSLHIVVTKMKEHRIEEAILSIAVQEEEIEVAGK